MIIVHFGSVRDLEAATVAMTNYLVEDFPAGCYKVHETDGHLSIYYS